ncbi:MAG: hypothetical protein ACRDKL_10110, partial [Solirubrobacteraceae bacterium]
YGQSRVYEVGPRPSGGPTSSGDVEHIVLAGPVIAYAFEENVSDGGDVGAYISRNLVIVRNLRTGRLLRTLPNGPSAPPDRIGGGYTTAVVVKRDGAVAWTTESQGPQGREYTVRAVDKEGEERVLASGSDVARASLALVGSTLYWTQAGRAMSAPLN